MKQKRTILLIAVFALLLAGAYLLYNNLRKDNQADQLVIPGNGQQQEQTEPSAPADSTETTVHLAPDFTVYDADGNPVRLHDFVGKPIVLNFWASWCGPCKSEMPEFQEMFDELDGQVQFLMVNAGGETASDVKSFLQQTGYTFPIYYDTANSAAIAYGVAAFPTTYFLNALGEAVTYAVGAIDKATLQKGISYIHP